MEHVKQCLSSHWPAGAQESSLEDLLVNFIDLPCDFQKYRLGLSDACHSIKYSTCCSWQTLLINCSTLLLGSDPYSSGVPGVLGVVVLQGGAESWRGGGLLPLEVTRPSDWLLLVNVGSPGLLNKTQAVLCWVPELRYPQLWGLPDPQYVVETRSKVTWTKAWGETFP